MDEQLKIEKERLKKRRGSIDLEKKDLTSGQLIVNTGELYCVNASSEQFRYIT